MFEHTDEAENVLYESRGLGTITLKKNGAKLQQEWFFGS